jgi:acyl-CoA hydrolase
VPAIATTADAKGAFELPVPWPGRLALAARAPKLGRTSITVESEGISEAGRVTPVELRFPTLFDLAIVAARDGAPAANVALEVVHRDASGPNTLAAAVTDASGRATLQAPAIAPLWLVAHTIASPVSDLTVRA